jgi:hypothetical protein
MKFISALLFLSSLAVGNAATEPCAPVPANFSLSPAQPRGSRELPDPFLTVQGSRITKKSEWACRRSEIAQLTQAYEFGPIPGPPTFLNASVVNENKLFVTVTVDGKTITFTANITYPIVGKAPYPALILFDDRTRIPKPPNIAIISFSIQIVAGSTYSGVPYRPGLFHDLYGIGHPARRMAAAVWAISRLIDAIELTAAQTSLDPTRLAITGCSRDARMVLAVGAFEERIALTIVQEAGEGGDSCYRLMQDDKAGVDICNTLQCEPFDPEFYGLRRGFKQFHDNPHQLPYDRHSVAALVAPRALLVLQGDGDFNQPRSSFQCMGATKKVYEALGVGDRMAVSLWGGHTLCSFPDGQQPLVDAYVAKFLLGEEGVGFDTDVLEIQRSQLGPEDIRSAYTWTVPDLE